MPEFVVEKNPEESNENESQGAIKKAKEATELQKLETERIVAKRQAELAEIDIKDRQELKILLVENKETQSRLGREQYDWENEKATQQSEIQKTKSELEYQQQELKKREQDLISRTQSLAIREQLVAEREELMNSVERKQLEEEERYNSLQKQIKRNFTRISGLMGDNANIFIKSGMRKFGNGLWDEIETMESWSKNDIGRHCNDIVEWLKGEIDDCNKRAVKMARNTDRYSAKSWNRIVDNLEEIFDLMPILRPENMPRKED